MSTPTTSRSLLPLLQLSDSAFPTGSFSHSLGLEGLVAAGLVRDSTGLEAAVAEHLGALATSDLPALRGAAEACSLQHLVALDHALAATRLAREQRSASAAMGRGLLDSADALGLDDSRLGAYHQAVRARTAPGGHAIAYGVVATAMGAPVRDALHAYAYTGCAAFVAAGQKLLLLGQRGAQRILFGLHSRISAAVDTSRHVDPAEPFAFAPLLEIASMAHERQTSRMYIS
jgi:urease accessory protein